MSRLDFFNPKKAIEKTRDTIPVKQQLGLLAVILLLIFSSALTPSFIASKFKSDNDTTNSYQPPVQQTTSDEVKERTAFTNITITGKSAYVWDVTNQRAVFKKNESEQLPLASLTKLMTALLAHELLQENDIITINDTAIRQDGASGLSSGETFDRLTLSDLTLMSSSNDGAYALAYAGGAVLTENDPANAFVQAMNIRAKEIGLSDTYFKNPTGLDISATEGGAYGTARDMAFLMEYIIKHNPTILSLTTSETVPLENTGGLVHEAENTNYYVNQIPGLIGSKTGYTDLAGGNLVVAFETGFGRPFIVAVLGSTRQERFSDVIALVNEVQTYVSEE